jgi:hypothetical protein
MGIEQIIDLRASTLKAGSLSGCAPRLHGSLFQIATAILSRLSRFGKLGLARFIKHSAILFLKKKKRRKDLCLDLGFT